MAAFAMLTAPLSPFSIDRSGRGGQAKNPVKAPSERDGIKEKEREQAQIGQQSGGE
jgi:hypothetical protein